MPPLKPVSIAPEATSNKVWLICLTIVCVAFGVRLLQWQNDFLTLDKNMMLLTARYKEEAQFLLSGDLTSFVAACRCNPLTDYGTSTQEAQWAGRRGNTGLV